MLVQGQYIARFWSKVDKSAGLDGCWPWTAYCGEKNYGQFWNGTRLLRAHRVAYELGYDEELGSLQVDHTCFYHPCCNPAHLRKATDKQNKENRQGAQRNNYSTGVRGVSQVRSGKFSAQVKHNNKKIHIGTFPSVEEAEKAVKAKRLELFTHTQERDDD
jgi:hypothetical protein